MRWLLFLIASVACLAEKTYDIQRASAPITIDGKLDEAAWQDAPAIGDFTFLWVKEGAREQTVAKLLWDDDESIRLLARPGQAHLRLCNAAERAGIEG